MMSPIRKRTDSFSLFQQSWIIGDEFVHVFVREMNRDLGGEHILTASRSPDRPIPIPVLVDQIEPASLELVLDRQFAILDFLGLVSHPVENVTVDEALLVIAGIIGNRIQQVLPIFFPFLVRLGGRVLLDEPDSGVDVDFLVLREQRGGYEASHHEKNPDSAHIRSSFGVNHTRVPYNVKKIFFGIIRAAGGRMDHDSRRGGLGEIKTVADSQQHERNQNGQDKVRYR